MSVIIQFAVRNCIVLIRRSVWIIGFIISPGAIKRQVFIWHYILSEIPLVCKFFIQIPAVHSPMHDLKGWLTDITARNILRSPIRSSNFFVLSNKYNRFVALLPFCIERHIRCDFVMFKVPLIGIVLIGIPTQQFIIRKFLYCRLREGCIIHYFKRSNLICCKCTELNCICGLICTLI